MKNNRNTLLALKFLKVTLSFKFENGQTKIPGLWTRVLDAGLWILTLDPVCFSVVYMQLTWTTYLNLKQKNIPVYPFLATFSNF